MGCVSSKNASCFPSPSPRRHHRRASSPPSGAERRCGGPLGAFPSSEPLDAPAAALDEIKDELEREIDDKDHDKKLDDEAPADVVSVRFERMAEGEQVAAGWPAWLAAVAGEAIDGWLPQKSNSFERLEKIGQGTYSNVYRARHLTTGKTVALKKVRFDNFQPESVRFMAREILILRRLDHPNIMKLEGIITSRLSCYLYLVFEYMEHDLSGLLSFPDVKFTDSQIKCFMQQLLTGLEHCHAQGIMHRDIKTSNILVNDEGILKIADFGLANFVQPKDKEPLTSRVVTLWYRPPELLLGATSYGGAVDLWSIGCVMGELYLGRPLIKGRTEVEQLHKIFRLCGSPSEDYWRSSRLPLASVFKPRHPYESMLRERCRELPTTAINLMETFLSVEPEKRGDVTSALNSEYFSAKPYPCQPSSMPKCLPSKEIDVQIHEDKKRKKDTTTKSEVGSTRNQPKRVTKPVQELCDSYKIVPMKADANAQATRKHPIGRGNAHRRRGSIESRASLKSYDTKSLNSVPSSSNFLWVKKKKQPDVFTRLHAQPTRCQKTNANEPTTILHERWESDREENDEPPGRKPRVQAAKPALIRKQARIHRQGSFDLADVYVPEEDLSTTDWGNKKTARRILSGPLVLQSQEQPHHRSRFYRD